ncbi:SecDF P1 head subdomain-containing protein [Roseateles sp. NT4]|uniref:SecDF P1 head subdomain-containing protein n=1 Tax=Roseateles sp. NT4 TaxID=3453715 RepID=UPI003EED0091
MHRSVTVLALGFAGWAGAAEVPCAATAEAAATAFVQSSIQAPKEGIPLLAPKSLASFRTRLAQLLDDRYAPSSGELRRRLHIEDLASAAATQMTDAEFVGAYFVAGAARAAPASLLDLAVTERREDRYLGEVVTVRYRLAAQGREVAQERTYHLSNDQGCWQMNVPLEARARLEQLASFLKESRVDPQFLAGKAPRLALHVAPASAAAFPASTRFSTPGSMGDPIWVADAPLLSAKDLNGVSAYWDCQPSEQGAEDAAVRLRFSKAAAARLERWSAGNVGAMLAVVLDGEVVTYAKVASKLSDRLSLCLPGKTLEQAQAIARRLAGQPA